MKILLFFLILKTAFCYNFYNPCKYDVGSFVRFNWRVARDYQLCTCNGTQVGTCYNRTQFQNYSNPTVKSAILKACQWYSPDLESCGVSNWKATTYACPRCSCTNKTKLTWFEKKSDWYSQCYYCDCQSTNTTKCTHFDYIYSYNAQKNSCPPKSMCEDTTASNSGFVFNYFNNRFLRGGTLKRTGSGSGLNTQFKYCNGTSGLIQLLTFNQIKSSAPLRAILLEDFTNSYNLQTCLNEPSRWTWNLWAPACLCPSTAVSGQSYYSQSDYKNLLSDSTLDNLKLKYCHQCQCSNNLWNCNVLGIGIHPIKCNANLLKCTDFSTQWTASTGITKVPTNEICLSETTCSSSSVTNFPDDMFTGAITAPNASTTVHGCAEDPICLLLGTNGQCKKAVLNSQIYRWNCATDSLDKVSVTGEDKMMCCNSNNCNANYDAYTQNNCAENADWTKMENLKFDLLFGESSKDVVEALGKLECEAKEKGNGGNGLGVLFEENSCSEPLVAKFLTNLMNAYCKYLAVGYNKLSSDGQVNSERIYNQFVSIYAGLMAESGCEFDPKCDLSTGIATGVVKTTLIKFTLLVNGTITNTTVWKEYAQGVIGKANLKNTKQITVNTKTRRRLSNGQTSYETIIATPDATSAAAITSSLQNSGTTLGGTVSNVQGDTTTNTVGSNSTGSPSGAMSLSIKFGFFLVVFLFCWL